MNSVAVEVEVDLPEGVRIRGYERHQGAHVFEVEFDLPSDCRCLKCGHEAEANIRYKNQTLVIRDLDLLGQPSFWVYQPPMHQCPRCRQRTQVPTPFKRPHVTYTSALRAVGARAACEPPASRKRAAAGRFGRDDRRHRGIPIGRRTRDSARTRDYQHGPRRAEPEEAAQIVCDGDERPFRSGASTGKLAVAKGKRDRAATDACLAKLSLKQRAAVRSHRTDMAPRCTRRFVRNGCLRANWSWTDFTWPSILGGDRRSPEKKHGVTS